MSLMTEVLIKTIYLMILSLTLSVGYAGNCQDDCGYDCCDPCGCDECCDPCGCDECCDPCGCDECCCEPCDFVPPCPPEDCAYNAPFIVDVCSCWDIYLTGTFIYWEALENNLDIAALSEKLGHPPLYVYLFTDDQNPKELKKRIEEYVGLGNITFDSREDSGEEIVDVLADFFSIQNFNYLIRSLGSHFAIAADYLSDHDLVITSKQRHWEKDCLGKFYLIVDSINIREGNKEEEVLLKY